jgi:ribonuclease G
MEEKSNQQSVHTALKEALAKDKAKTNVLPMSDLGLIEMTRKRTRPSLNRLLSEPCPYCEGKGLLKSRKEICYEIFRGIERESVFPGDNSDIIVSVNPSIGNVLREEEYESLRAMENSLKKRIIIDVKENFHLEQYEIYA